MGAWVHPQSEKAIAMSVLSCGKVLVGTGWAIPHFHMNGLKKQSSDLVHVGLPFGTF